MTGFCFGCWSGCAGDAFDCSCGAQSGESDVCLMPGHHGQSVRVAYHQGREACMALALLLLQPWQQLAVGV